MSVICPFCRTVCDPVPAVSRCPGCGAERRVEPGGDVIFDSKRKGDRQTVADASRTAGASLASGLDGGSRRRPVRLGKKRRG